MARRRVPVEAQETGVPACVGCGRRTGAPGGPPFQCGRCRYDESLRRRGLLPELDRRDSKATE